MNENKKPFLECRRRIKNWKLNEEKWIGKYTKNYIFSYLLENWEKKSLKNFWQKKMFINFAF